MTDAVVAVDDQPILPPRQAEDHRSHAAPSSTCPSSAEGPPAARYRMHRVPPRNRAVKVLYGDDELEDVRRAAARAGLRPSSWVAAVALAAATGAEPPVADGQDREVLAELLRSRLAVRQYGTNLNQIAAALNSGVAHTPIWLAAAIAGADRATARIDEAAGLLTRRLA